MQLLAPVIRGKKGEHVKVFENARKQRLCPRARGRRDSTTCPKNSSWQRTKKHNIEIVVDRVVMPSGRPRTPYGFGGDRARRCPAVCVICGCHRRRTASRSRRTTPATTAAFPSTELYAADVLVQQPVRRVPGVHRSGHSEARRSRPRHSGPPPFHQAGRHSRARLGERRHGQHRARCTTTHSAKSTALRWTRLSRSSPSRHSTSCCTAPEE